jgi:Cu-Zn family superoxide dismutase
VQGVVTFSEVRGGIRIVANIEGLIPGKHGFHIHEHGACNGTNEENAGGHFNPDDHPHAGPNDSPRHAGDLGNLVADLSGRAHYDRLDFVITLDGHESIVGRSVVIHKYPDDLISQPSGNTGPAVACGVIIPFQEGR